MRAARVPRPPARRVATRRGERGAAAVEFALVLPVLLMIVLGAIDWGWYFYVRQVVTNAAREGARAGAVNAVSAAGAEADGRAAATAYLNGLSLAAGGRSVSATTLDLPLGGTTLHTVQVVVTYPVGSLTGFSLPGFTSLAPSTVTATAQMRREGL
jgi:Flp pilus assembly protein TadG